MIEAVAVSVIVAFVGWIASTVWSNWGHLGLMLRSVRIHRRVRISVAVLLRVQYDDTYVLVHSPLRPNVFGPLGGAVKFLPAARIRLDALHFQEERRANDRMRHDLRGFLPSRSLPAFARWLAKQDDRESATECLRRELIEELAEVGHPELSACVSEVHFSRVRAVMDGPHNVPARSCHQVRFLEVWDLDLGSPGAVSLRDGLLRIGHDSADTGVICADAQDIAHGRKGEYYLAPQSAFLMGAQRLHADLPAPP